MYFPIQEIHGNYLFQLNSNNLLYSGNYKVYATELDAVIKLKYVIQGKMKTDYDLTFGKINVKKSKFFDFGKYDHFSLVLTEYKTWRMMFHDNCKLNKIPDEKVQEFN